MILIFFNMPKILVFLILFNTSLTFAETNSVPKQKNDLEIQSRITNIIKASEMFPQVSLKVNEGLVFLSGTIKSEDDQKWLEKVINNTEGVVALIDKTSIENKSSSVLEPAKKESALIFEKFNRLLPYIASSIIIFLVFLGLALMTHKFTYSLIYYRGKNILIANAAAKGFTALIILIGLYFALRSSGLSGLAFTVLGGTGALGIGLGLALKGTLENYIAGIMISLRDIFRKGEVVEVAGYEGIIQAVTTRGTTIMDYEGNSITIPNSNIISASIKNLTRNPNMRLDFVVGIGYDDSIDQARQIIIDLFNNNSDKILKDPKHLITVDSLGAATVNLRVYFWIDAVKFSHLRLRSWAIQKVKESFVANKISMPDDAREIVFASPLEIKSNPLNSHKDSEPKKNETPQKHSKIEAHLNLENDIQEIRRQALNSEAPEKGESLI
jgi:small conductance mechanosensitive channel